MRKLFMFVLFSMFMVSGMYAGNISVNSVSNINSQCNISESKDIDYYIEWSSVSRNPYDIFWNTLDSLISHTSEIDLWRNTNIVTNCNDWSRVSNVTVANDSNWAVALHNVDWCTFNVPSTNKYNDIDRLDAQIHYDIAYAKVFPWAPNHVDAQFYHRDLSQNTWICYPAGNVVSNYSSCPVVWVDYGIMNHHIWECLDYRLFWCGDWILNGRDWDNIYTNGTFNSEQCDPADQSHQWRGNDWCSTTCESLSHNEPHICGDGSIDLPNDSWVNEQCDDNNLNNGDWCNSNCMLETPTCNLTVNPGSQVQWNNVNFVANKSTWATYMSFDLGDSTILSSSNIVFPYAHMYNSVWNYSASLQVSNEYSPIAVGVVSPTAICNTNINITNQIVDLSLDKILLTVGNLIPWDIVEYEINLTNNGTNTYQDAYINDILPSSLDLLPWTNIVWVSPYNYAQWQDWNLDWSFTFSWFDLAPGQTATVHVRWQIRVNASSNETTNCAFTDGYTDCVMFSLSSKPYLLKSQMMSNGSMSTSFTTSNMNVNFNDYITYRIDFENVWWSDTNWWIVVRDHMPLCIDYVNASIYGVSSSAVFSQYQDLNGRRVLTYNNFDLLEGQAWYMIVTWKVMNIWVCAGINTYINDAYLDFYNPFEEVIDSVEANRSDLSVVVLTKDSDTDVNMPWDDKLFEIRVENFGPNPISNIVLDDVWPSGSCINYVNWTGVWFVKNPFNLIWTYTGVLNVGDYKILYISGSINNDQSCVNADYINTVNLTYTELSSDYDLGVDYHFSVVSTPVADILLTKTANMSSVSSWNELEYTIYYENVWTATLNSYVITDFWPATVDFVSAAPFPSSVVDLVTWSILQWNFSTSLAPGQTWEIIIEWIVN